MITEYLITYDSETSKGSLEVRIGARVERQDIKDFSIAENHAIHHYSEGEVVHVHRGERSITFSMKDADPADGDLLPDSE